MSARCQRWRGNADKAGTPGANAPSSASGVGPQSISVCPRCEHHGRIGADARFAQLLDEGFTILASPKVAEEADMTFNIGQWLSVPLILLGAYLIATSRTRKE